MALTLSHYRFGIDSGTESTHGWHAALDTNPAEGVIALDTTFLLRFCVQANTTGLSNVDNEFQYRINGGTWTNITTTSSFVRAVAATALTNGSNCTSRLGGTGTFESTGAGQTEDGTSGGTANDIVASGNSETECGLQLRSADLTGGELVEFRLTRDGGTLLDTYAVTPSITIPVAAVNVDPSLIASTATVPSAFVDPVLLGSLIASTASVPAPDIDTGTNVDAARIESTASVPSPSADPSLLATLLAAASVVFVPAIDQALAVPRIDSTSTIASPALAVSIDVARIDSTSMLAPDVAVWLAPSVIASTSVPSPSANPLVDAPVLASTEVPSPYVGGAGEHCHHSGSGGFFGMGW